MNGDNLPYIHNKVYPFLLLDLQPSKIKEIINNSFLFVAQRLEVDMLELLVEIEIAATKEVSQTTINHAIDVAEDFMDDLMNTFNVKFDANNFEKRRHNMKKGYMGVFNKPKTLWFVKFQNGQDGVVSLPLIVSLWEASSVIFDYAITKSDEMNHMTSKSSDTAIKKIRSIKSKRQARYQFVKSAVRYGANELQLIRNFDTAFGKNNVNAITSLQKLPNMFKYTSIFPEKALPKQ